MCIILYKPKGIELPNDCVIEECFNNNPDGAGIMFRQNNDKIKITKGFMILSELYNVLNNIDNVIDTDLVIHFRFATQGKICPENCHPFPITNKVKELKAIEIESNIGLVHNGVIPFCSNYKRNTLSDTQIFIKDYLSKIPVKQFRNSAITNLIYEATNSKFIIMTEQKTILIGKFIEENSIFYSNSTYKKYKVKSKKYINEKFLCDMKCNECTTFQCCEY